MFAGLLDALMLQFMHFAVKRFIGIDKVCLVKSFVVQEVPLSDKKFLQFFRIGHTSLFLGLGDL
jgi:hypothetical protein